MFNEISNWIKDHTHLFSIIGTVITVCTLIFSIGSFYNRFTGLERNIDVKMQSQEKVVQTIRDEQNNRIQNLENLMLFHVNNVNEGVTQVKEELKKNRNEMKKNNIQNKSFIVHPIKIDSVHVRSFEDNDTITNKTK